jgi:hypothetical protein
MEFEQDRGRWEHEERGERKEKTWEELQAVRKFFSQLALRYQNNEGRQKEILTINEMSYVKRGYEPTPTIVSGCTCHQTSQVNFFLFSLPFLKSATRQEPKKDLENLAPDKNRSTQSMKEIID